MKFNENPSSGKSAVPCGRTDPQTDGRTGGQTDMTKLTVLFSQFRERV
jgi:hypothetical protein